MGACTSTPPPTTTPKPSGGNGIQHARPSERTPVVVAHYDQSPRDVCDRTPTLEPARSLVDGWIESEKYARGAALRQLVNWSDHRDPVLLLAHVHEVAESSADCRCAMLWARVGPLNGQAIVPSDAAVAWAKKILGGHPGGEQLVGGVGGTKTRRPRAKRGASKSGLPGPISDVLSRRKKADG